MYARVYVVDEVFILKEFMLTFSIFLIKYVHILHICMYRSSGRKRRTVLSKKTAPPSITASPSGEKLNQPSSPNVSSSLRTEIFSPYIALPRRLFITIATAILTILVSVETRVYYNVCMHARSGQCVAFSSLCCGEGSGGGWIGR